MKKYFPMSKLLTSMEMYNLEQKGFKFQKMGQLFSWWSEELCMKCAVKTCLFWRRSPPNSLTNATCLSSRHLSLQPRAGLLKTAEKHKDGHTEVDVFLRSFYVGLTQDFLSLLSKILLQSGWPGQGTRRGLPQPLSTFFTHVESSLSILIQ